MGASVITRNQTDLCTCLKCGWVYMAYTREKAQTEVDGFNAWYNEQPPETQEHYGNRPSSITRYEGCHCGSKEFRAYREGDCPRGVTIGPTIWEPETEEDSGDG